MILDEVLSRLGALDPAAKAEAIKIAVKATADMKWVPNPGPQTEAYFCPADELFYGGQAGGGKTDLGIGLALTQHKRSLILRRINKDALKLVSRLEKVIDSRDGYNGQLQRWRLADRQIDIAGCEQESDKQRFKGDPHDLIIFDEGTDFLESQFRFIIGWNRSSTPNQRCRVVVTSNPPTTSEGLWVIHYWGPWLDPTHPNPAKPGELRWFSTINGEDTEVDGPGPHTIPGEVVPIRARSRTFIRASVSDNPDLDKKEVVNEDGTISIVQGDYHSVLAGMPDELRRAYRDGDFSVGLKDGDFQVIPTAWIQAAQKRWTPDGYRGFRMTAMAFDPAGGGKDAAELCFRHGGWYGELISEKGEQTADGAKAAGLLIAKRKDGAAVVIDVGGGYGGAVSQVLKDNSISFGPFNGANATKGKTQDGQLEFVNKRAEAWWRFREALDPEQEGGSPIALPSDPELRADLAAPTYSVTPRGILLESKEHIRKRLGRSPGKGDAVVMCLSEGTTQIVKQLRKNKPNPPTNIGYSNLKRYAR